MLVDLSVKVTKFVRKEATQNVKKASFGHLGTHFDVMNKEFPLSYVKREGVVFKQVSKFKSDVTCFTFQGEKIWLLKPLNYMNNSGESLRAFTDFYKLHRGTKNIGKISQTQIASCIIILICSIIYWLH